MWHPSCFDWYSAGRGSRVGFRGKPHLRKEDVFYREQIEAAYEGCKYRGRCNHLYERECDDECAACHKTVPRHTLELDHILAVGVAERLGEVFYRRVFTLTNLWWICHDCHVVKTAYDRMCMRLLDNPCVEEDPRTTHTAGFQAPMMFEEDRPERFLPCEGETMKALTIHQPYASLIAEGKKTIETRGWRPPEKLIGSRIAIHAAKREPEGLIRHRNGDIAAYELSLYGEIGHLVIGKGRIPTGVVVATARLVSVAQVIEYDGDTARVRQGNDESVTVRIDQYGDFSVGRWLWLLADVCKFREPIPARGYQRLWEWDGIGN